MGKFRTLNRVKFTLYFFPESGGKVESVSIVGDRKLSGGSGGSSKETDLPFGVGSDAVAKAGQGDVSKDLKLLKGHEPVFKFLFELAIL
jgi:hypothetical protein